MNTFGILIDKIFSICGVCSYTIWTDEVFQLFFDFPINSFAYPKTCRVEVKSGHNAMFHFLESYKFPTTPSVKEVDAFLQEEEKNLTNWIQKRWCYEHPPTYLKILLNWMFFFVIRRIFDFTGQLWIEKEEAKHLKELYLLQPKEFRFW